MRLTVIYLLLGWLFQISSVKSQPLIYQFSAFQLGNPLGLNSDVDTIERSLANGFSQLLTTTSSLPSFSPNFSIPFNFRFFGQTASRFCVSHTGLLSFDTSRAGSITAPSTSLLNTNSLPNRTIAAFWGNFPFPAGTGAQAGVYSKVYGQAPNRQLWIDWVKFDLNNGTDLWFSLVLEEGTDNIYMVDRRQIGTTPQPFRCGLKKNNAEIVEIPGGFINLTAGTPSVSDNRFVRFSPKSLSSDTTEVFNNFFLGFSALPNPYTSLANSTRQQFILNKRELNALRTNNLLTSISFFFLPSLLPPTYSNFSIKLKNHPDTVLSTGFVSGATEVYFAASYPSVVDWNRHDFQTPYEWDTTQNLVVEVCFRGSNAPPFSLSEVSGQILYPGVSLGIAQNNSTQICSQPYIPNIFFPAVTEFRPDFRLIGVEPYLDLLAPRIDSLSRAGDSCVPVPRLIRARVRDNRGTARVNLLHRAFNASTWDSIPMTPASQGFWQATLPPRPAGVPWQFTVAAIDSSGNKSDTLSPRSFTDGSTVFTLGPDITAIQGTLKRLSPNRDGVKGLKITEVILASGPAFSSQLQTTFPANAPSVFSADEVLEIQNVSNSVVDISGFQLEWLLSNPAVPRLNFVFPTGTLVGPNEIVLVYSGSLPNQANDKIFYVGSFANLLLPTEQAGFILKDTANVILDAVAVNGFSFSPNTGATLDDWNGQIFVPSNSTGIRRENETNQAADWKVITTGRDTTSFGFTNPKMLRDLAQYFWRKSPSSQVISESRELPIVVQSVAQYHLEVILGSCSFRDTININTLNYCTPTAVTGLPFLKEWRLGSFTQSRQTASEIQPLNLQSGITLVAGKGPYRMIGVIANTGQSLFLSAWIDLNRDGQLNDSTEKLFQTRSVNDTAYAQFSIPAGGISGSLLLRIALHTDSLVTSCGPFQAFHEDVVAQYILPSEDLVPPTLSINQTSLQNCIPSPFQVFTHIEDQAGSDSVRVNWTLWPDGITGSIPAQWDSIQWRWTTTINPPAAQKLLAFQAVGVDFNQNVGRSKEEAVSNQIDAVYAGIDTVSRVGSSLIRRGGFTRNGLVISEILLIPALQGARANADSTTSLFWGPDMVEITNVSDTIQDVGGYRLKVEVIQSAVPNYYEAIIPTRTLLAPGETLVFTAGTYIFQLPPKLIPFNFASTRPDIWDYNDRMAMALFNPSGYAVDAVFLNDHEPLNPQDWPGARMYGKLIPDLVSGIQRTRAEDLDLASDWESTTSNSGRVMTIGKKNPVLSTQQFRCSWTDSATSLSIPGSLLSTTFVGKKTWIFSARYNQCTITDTFVAEADTLFRDLKMNRFVQPSTAAFWDSVAIGVWISNQGIVPVDTFEVSLYDNNSLYTTDTLFSRINAGDSILHFFTNLWAAAQPGFRGLRATVWTKGDRNSSNDSIYLLVNSQVSAKALTEELWLVYPNPAKSIVNVQIPEAASEDWTLTLIDNSGRIIKQEELSNRTSGTAPYRFNLQGILPGLYMIQASHPQKGQRHWKLIVE